MRKVSVTLLALLLMVTLVGTSVAQTPNVKLGSRPVNLTVSGAPQPNAAVSLVLDDGTVENSIGLNSLTAAYQFEWFNRFTPAPADFPFNLTQISLAFCDVSVPVGGAIELLVYTDTDGNGDPSNGVLVGDYSVTVLANDCSLNVYTLSPALRLDGPGDVLIGAVNRFVTSGVTPPSWPAAIDTTASQLRSWIAWWNLDPPVPPTLPPDYALDLVDNFGFAGNWIIRGTGETIVANTMHVGAVVLTKTGTGPWVLTAKGKIHDGAHANLAGVKVTAQWLLPNGTKVNRQFLTNAQGGYQFNLNAQAAGQYRFCIVQLLKAGYTYMKADNHPNPPCKVITVP